jgi:mevalonate kinase
MKTFGKVILAGEHAVVYGEMALVAQISLGVKVEVVVGKKETDLLIRKAIDLAGGKDKVGVKITSEIPIGSGLGSSAAVAAAIIKQVRNYFRKPIGEDELFEYTMECERIAHGNPSGIDPASVVYGGLITFVKGKPIEKLKIKNKLKLLLVNSGKPGETTREMVELVAQQRGKEKNIREIGKIAREIRDKLAKGEEIGQLINKNGYLLEKLGVVGKKAITLANKLREMGAAVKITGAGGVKTGSGMMMVIHPNLEKIGSVLRDEKIDYWPITIGTT